MSDRQRWARAGSTGEKALRETKTQAVRPWETGVTACSSSKFQTRVFVVVAKKRRAMPIKRPERDQREMIARRGGSIDELDGTQCDGRI